MFKFELLATKKIMEESFRYAPNIIVALGDGEDGVSVDFERFKAQIMKNLFEIMKNNWTGYGVILLVSELKHKKIFITPGRKSEAISRKNQKNWGYAVEVKIAEKDIRGNNESKPGFLPDEILLHELIHAYFMYRPLAKKSQYVFVYPNFKYNNSNEFNAILLTNIYMSAKGRYPLRKEHIEIVGEPVIPLENKYTDNRNFLFVSGSRGFPYCVYQYPHQKLIRDLILEAPELLRGYVRHDGGIFNPVRYFLNDGLFHKQQEEIENRLKPPEPMMINGERIEVL